MPPKINDFVNGKFRLVRALGEGGMGSVFEATHEGLGTRVAIKFLHAELAHRNEVLQRFVQEARLVAKVKSPHVVTVQDVETTSDGIAFIVLEFLEGKTLQRMLEELHRAGRRIDRSEALDLAVQMLEGADAAHRAGVVHRDLKPDNVMIVEGPQGEPYVKLLDFGIAKFKTTGRPGMTRPGVIMGTPEYMAPEQAFSSDLVDARADVFALGVMIFEMLADGRPLAGDDPQVLAAAHLSGDVPKLGALVTDLPYGLADVVDKAMSARPEDRYGSAGEFLQALRPFTAAAIAASVRDQPTTAYGATAYAPNNPSRPPQPLKGLTTPLASWEASNVGPKPSSQSARFGSAPPTQPAQNVVPMSRSAPYTSNVEPTVGDLGFGAATGNRTVPWDPSSSPPSPGPGGSPSSPPITGRGLNEPTAIEAAGAAVPDHVVPAHARRGIGLMWVGLLVFLGLLAALAVGLFVFRPTHETEEPRAHQPGPTHVPTAPPQHKPHKRK